MERLKDSKFIAMAMFVVMLSMSLMACSDDDDDDKGISLEGTAWVLRDYSEKIVFTSSNSGRWYYDLNYGDEYDSFTYTYSSKKGGFATVKVVEDGKVEYVKATFKIENDVLYIYDEDGNYDSHFYKYDEDD